MTTKIYVWETRAHIFHNNPDLTDHGHVSALVSSTYISFWPSDDTGKKPKKAKISSRIPYFVQDYQEDCSELAMHRRADHAIEIRNLREQPMLSYWREIQTKQNNFHFISSNCSTVVGRMLLKSWDPFDHGLGTILKSLMQAIKSEAYYWEPSDVLDLARRIKDSIG